MTSESCFEFRTLIAMLLRHCLTILFSGLLLSVIVTPLFLFGIRPNYTAETRLLISDEALTVTSVYLVKEPFFLQQIIEKHQLEFPLEKLLQMTEVSALSQTNLIRIQVTAKEPYTASHLANIISEEAARWIPDTLQKGSVRIVTRAIIPSEIDGVTPLQVCILSIPIGSALAILALLLWAVLQEPVIDGEELAIRYQIPLLGEWYGVSAFCSSKKRKQKIQISCEALMSIARERRCLLLASAGRDEYPDFYRLLSVQLGRCFGNILMVGYQKDITPEKPSGKPVDAVEDLPAPGILIHSLFPGVDALLFAQQDSSNRILPRHFAKRIPYASYSLIWGYEGAPHPPDTAAILVCRLDQTCHRQVREKIQQLALTGCPVIGFLLLR